MKTKTALFLAAVALTGSAFAGTEASSKEYKQSVSPTPCFKDQELSLDVFYSYNDAIDGGGTRYFHDRSGGGVGVNYFFTRYIGMGVEGNWWAGAPHHDALHQVTGNVILRYPLEVLHVCAAPYIFGGGGESFDNRHTSAFDAGVGFEVRLTQNVGVFTDWRYNWTGQDRNNVDTTRAGIRFAF